MYRLAWRDAWFFLAALLLVGCSKAWALTPAPASAPTLFTVSAAQPQVMLQGAAKSWPIHVSAETAMTAVFQGGMWLPNPEGGRIYAKYQRHIIHQNGTWTWIGTVSTVHGDQSVVLTFGNGAVFGDIPQASGGYPLQISTRVGQTSVIATNAAALARSPAWLQMHSQPDYVVPPPPRSASERARAAALKANPPPSATAAAPVTIDLMVAYTTGLVTAYGSQSVALTRIQYLVDWANQAYVNSGVYQQLRLVHTVEVNYTDGNSDGAALNDLAGVNSALNNEVAPLRAQYGADLVSLVRPYDVATQAAGQCGIGYLNGAGGNVLMPQWGFSVVSDISDGTNTNGVANCGPNTFAHELGHNMGNAHDRANSTSAGAYPYSYGYKNSTVEICTIMAYCDSSDETQLQVFSNPDITFCKNSPCGIADSSPESADNAHSMNNTAPVVAAFEPTMVGNTGLGQLMMARNDVTGGGRSALLWMNATSNTFGYWAMDGNSVSNSWAASVPPGYYVVATGDFTGDGKADLVWTSAARDLYLWESDGTGFKADYIGTYPAGWEVVGAGDVDGDGKADLLWFNTQTSTFAYWIMNGPDIVRGASFQVAPGWQVGAVGNFNGDGRADIVWENPTSPDSDLYLWVGNGTGFASLDLGNYASAGNLIGVGNVDNEPWGPALLFFNAQTGTFSYYNLVVTNTKAYYYSSWSTQIAPGYSIAAIGDFNGDGMTGVVWTSAAHDLYLWESNGQSFNTSYIGTYPAGWSVIPSQLMAWSAQP